MIRPATDPHQAIRDELTDMARNGSPATRKFAPVEQAQKNLNAAGRTSALRLLQLIAFGAIAACLPVTPLAYIGVAICAVGLIAAIVRLNNRHRDAYMQLQKLNGFSEIEALRNYTNRYSGS
jgi:hypothetical protein